WLVLSALLAVLSVWSKQVMGPIVFTLPLWLLWGSGFKVCGRYCLALVLTGLGVAGVFLLLFDARALFFNVVTIPGKHPWEGEYPDNLLRVLREFLTAGWPLGIFLLAGVGFTGLDRRVAPEGAPWPARHRWSVFLLAGLGVLPLCLLGRLKVGGDLNALSFALYLLLLAVCLLLREGMAGRVERRLWCWRG